MQSKSQPQHSWLQQPRRRPILTRLAFVYSLAIIIGIPVRSGAEQTVPQADRVKIRIIDAEKPSPYIVTRVDAGPSVGNMLGNHFFPGIDHYNAGRYMYAQIELTYVLERPAYLDGNRHRNDFMSVAHYLSGMIYMYHADGLGRRNVAAEHFDQAIEWNPDNHIAYLELARVYAELRLTKQASAIVQRLLDSNPPEDIQAQARNELDKFSSPDK